MTIQSRMKTQSIRSYGIVFMLILLLILGGCTSTSATSQPQAFVDVSGSMPEYSLVELTEESDLIIKGTISNKSEPIAIRPANGGADTLYTDFEIQVEETYRGEADGDKVILRLQGGETEKLVVHSDLEPDVDVGESYVFFLFRPVPNGREITERDFYYLVASYMGLMSEYPVSDIAMDESAVDEQEFNEPEQRLFTNAQLVLDNNDVVIQENDEVIKEDEISEVIMGINEETPVDTDWRMEGMAPELAEKLENEEISLEEFEEEYIKEYPYATVIDADDIVTGLEGLNQSVE